MSSPVTGADRSGLIQGLRGEPPFDGSRFPRLPWGGRPVPDEGINLIAEWINDGCPRTDADLASFDLAGTTPVTIAPEEFSFADTGVNEYLFERGELKQRLNVDCMTPRQLEKLRYAMRELYELNKWVEDSRSYNNLALIHQNHCQHGWARFLPWHRIYLYEFEQALQDHCPDVTMPYWDWTMAQYCPETPEKGSIIPPAFQAFLTTKSLDFLGAHGFKPKVIEKRQPMVNQTYVSPHAFFGAVSDAVGDDYTKGEHRKRFIDALLDANSLWYPLRYPAEYQDQAGHDSTINKVVHYHYPTAEDIEQILSLRTFRDFGGGSSYDDAFGFIDQNPHNTLHIWTGGMNPDTPKPKPPDDRNKAVKVVGRRFHCRDDIVQPAAARRHVQQPHGVVRPHLLARARQRRPALVGVAAAPSELESGGARRGAHAWSYTIRDTLDMHRFGYEYVKATSVVPVGAATPV